MHYSISDFWYEQSKPYGELGPVHCAGEREREREREREGGGWSRSNHCSRYSTDTEHCPTVVLSASTLKPDGFGYQFF
jgi:hypothetical protein